MRPQTNRTITQSRLILCEGEDENRFFTALLQHLGLTDSVQVWPVGGKRGFATGLALVRNDARFPEVESLLVVRDADHPETEGGGGYAATWESVSAALANVGLVPPTRSATFDSFVARPRVAVLLMPGDGSDGMLETLCLRAVSTDPATACVSSYFDCLAALPEPICHPVHKSDKARVHTFLSSRERPDLRLGEAAEKGYWPWNSPAFAELIRLIREL